ncbi:MULTISPECIES: potassium-transporting ATPase subunit KdpC [unclassified Duganella]|uniref:potassium-transporting ATPase subunit KdpC n=1 Tax=unclassified Duganella TaxID=2636909 RepID=UPI00088931FB|nr:MULTISPECIES: potassium-transporting ATPase subunit KdpC [unclassified Duganella]SDG26089.1 K+-transporting ATPase ATPase C chain [Duganella sp. OV458]SDJ21833.1 K+-transporting ATPase ATPase C chain [Duganella sp. OV510]
MASQLRPALTIFAALTLLCGVLYPLAVTGIGLAVFPAQAGGSIVAVNGKAVGSSLIGQAFTSPQYFWGRPSATAPMANNAAGSGGANQGPTNPALLDAVKSRIDALKAADPANTAAIPIDLVTASASGLDPEISVAGARYQAGRVAGARKISHEQVLALIAQHTQPQWLGFFGEARVNVLALNLALDRASPHSPQ